MAVLSFTRGVKLVIKVGNGASPEVFAALCTINAARGIKFTAGTNDEALPDCTTPEAVAWIYREKQSLSVEVTGGGKSHKNDVKKLWDWYIGNSSKNCQVVMDDPVVGNVITFKGAFHLTEFDLNGDLTEKVSSTMSLASDGVVTAVFGASVST